MSGVALTSVSASIATTAATASFTCCARSAAKRRPASATMTRPSTRVTTSRGTFGFGLHRDRAALQDAETERGDDDEQRFEIADERDGDGDEPVAGREPGVEAVQHAHDDGRAAQAGDRTRERHRRERGPAQIDAGAARGFGRFAGRAQFVAEHGAREDVPQRRGEQQRDEEADREPRVRERASAATPRSAAAAFPPRPRPAA